MRHSGLKLWRAIGLSVGLMVLLGSDFVSVASASGFRHKDDWIYNASNQIQTNFPRVDAIMWFHQDKSSNPNDRNWRVDTDPNALQAYRNSWQARVRSTISKHWWACIRFGSAGSSLWTSRSRCSRSRRSRPAGRSRISFWSRSTHTSATRQGAARVGWMTFLPAAFGHEMNGDWFTWGYVNGHNGNTPQDFIDAFRYVVDVFRDAGADNVSWVWTINASWTDDFSVAFPGEDYVDRMGMNGFNWGDFPKGTHQTWEADFYRDWRDFEEIFGQWDPYNPNGVHNYNRLCELDPDAPIIIGEFASTPEPATAAFLVLGATGLLFQRRRWS